MTWPPLCASNNPDPLPPPPPSVGGRVHTMTEQDMTAPCLACGLRIDGRQDYCASCWDDLMDWLGWS